MFASPGPHTISMCACSIKKYVNASTRIKNKGRRILEK